MEFSFITKIIMNFFYVPFVAFLVYLGLSKEAVFGLAILLAVDIVTGVAKEFKLGRKPQSRRFTKGIMSKMILLLIPFILAIAAKAINIDITSIVWIVINAMILSEAYSSMANIYTVSTGREVEEFDAMSLILGFIKDRIEKMLGER